MRLDRYLTEHGYTDSRTKAQRMIEAGCVKLNGILVRKCAYELTEAQAATLCVEQDPVRYVSRGGCKLEAALDTFTVSVAGLRVCDLGSSTGGFTDCLLQRGAARVYAVDCGTDQLHPSLRNNPRVCVMEQTNARTLTAQMLGGRCPLVTADLSFISQTAIFPAVCRILLPDGRYICLIKPQFEVGRKALSKNGVVRDEKMRLQAVKMVQQAAATAGLRCLGTMTSPITGGDGNVEYLAIFAPDLISPAFEDLFSQGEKNSSR